jgi:hypothetical protein
MDVDGVDDNATLRLEEPYPGEVVLGDMVELEKGGLETTASKESREGGARRQHRHPEGAEIVGILLGAGRARRDIVDAVAVREYLEEREQSKVSGVLVVTRNFRCYDEEVVGSLSHQEEGGTDAASLALRTASR